MAEAIEKRFFYKGVEYDSEGSAAKARTLDLVAEITEYDPMPEVKSFEHQFNSQMFGSAWEKKRFPERQNGYAGKLPMLLIIEDKYTKQYYLIKSTDDFKNISLDTITQRCKEGWYEGGEENKIVSAIIETKNGSAAFAYLDCRSVNEYEFFEVSRFESIPS